MGRLGLVSVLRDRAREDALNLKFEKIKTNMAARGLLSKSLFSLSLMRPSRYHLIFPSRALFLQSISKEKNVFKSLCCNLNEKGEVDATIDRAGYQTSKIHQPKKFSSAFLRFLYLASLTFGYIYYSSSTAYAGKSDDEKENTAGDTLERWKGRFPSKRRSSAVKNLTKANLKRPMANEHNGENIHEPIEKKMARSREVSFFNEENCCKCCKLACI